MVRSIVVTVRRALIAAVLCTASSASALAHPLGNFTINHLTKIAIAGPEIHVRYVLDMAEIPTYVVMREHGAAARFGTVELAEWAHRQAQGTIADLALTLNGNALALSLVDASAHTRPGAGGLPTLYLTANYVAPLPSSATGAFSFNDGTFAGRLGWRDVVIAPQTEPTHELTAYPNALLGSPRDVTFVSARLETGGRIAVAPLAPQDASAAAPSAVRSNQLADMLARGSGNPWFVLLTLAVALALGALHALEPGHGKTLLAVSLVGARATVGQAAVLAAALTIAHTAGVVLLGLAIVSLKGAFTPESVYPWITLLCGAAIAVVGARALARQVQSRVALAHTHNGRRHTHDDIDEETHARGHAIGGEAPLRFGPAVWAAMSGGIAPCPAALVVLLAATAQHAVAYGLIAILVFSLGLACTLTGLGIAVVRGAMWLSANPAFDRFVRHGPLVSALVIAIVGAVMVGQGARDGGFGISPVAVSLLVVAAIAGFALSHPFTHRHAEVA